MVGCDPSDEVEELESDSEKRAASSGCGKIVEARAIAGGVGGCTTKVAALVAPVIEASVGSDVGCVCELREDEVLRGMEGRGHPAIFEFRE